MIPFSDLNRERNLGTCYVDLNIACIYFETENQCSDKLFHYKDD